MRLSAKGNRSSRGCAIAISIVVVLSVGAACGSSTSTGSSSNTPSNSEGGSVEPRGTQTFPENNHNHVTGTVSYDRTPPAGGAHNAVWLNCGIYDQPVPNENAVHSLEHGTVWITYRPDLPSDEVAQLRQLVSSHYRGAQRYLLLSPYPGLPSPIVASAWGAQLFVQQAGDTRLLQFIEHFEGGGQGGEAGALCTGGMGTQIG